MQPLGVLTAYDIAPPGFEALRWNSGRACRGDRFISSALTVFHNPHDHYLLTRRRSTALPPGCLVRPGRAPLPASFAAPSLCGFQRKRVWHNGRLPCQPPPADGNQALQMQKALQSLLEEPAHAAPLPEPLTYPYTRQPSVRSWPTGTILKRLPKGNIAIKITPIASRTLPFSG